MKSVKVKDVTTWEFMARRAMILINDEILGGVKRTSRTQSQLTFTCTGEAVQVSIWEKNKESVLITVGFAPDFDDSVAGAVKAVSSQDAVRLVNEALDRRFDLK